MTAPENARRPHHNYHRQRVSSATANPYLNDAIRDSICTLQGFSEGIEDPQQLNNFRESYLRDLNDYLKMVDDGRITESKLKQVNPRDVKDARMMNQNSPSNNKNNSSRTPN